MAALTDAAGFEITRTVDIGAGWSVIEATRPRTGATAPERPITAHIARSQHAPG